MRRGDVVSAGKLLEDALNKHSCRNTRHTRHTLGSAFQIWNAINLQLTQQLRFEPSGHAFQVVSTAS